MSLSTSKSATGDNSFKIKKKGSEEFKTIFNEESGSFNKIINIGSKYLFFTNNQQPYYKVVAIDVDYP